MRDDSAFGAYGLRIEGLSDPSSCLVAVPSAWPEMRVSVQPPTPVDRLALSRSGNVEQAMEADDQHAVIRLVDGEWIELQREPLTMHIRSSRNLPTDVVLHPYLGLPATVAARWQGRIALHAGAFIHGGRAVALVGDREAGKSSTLGELLRREVPILADDVLVIEGTTACAGPRTLDLRRGPAALLGGEPLGLVGSRLRWRLRPGGVPAAVRLCAIVSLEWGDALRVEPLGHAERLRSIVSTCALVPREAESLALLDLAALPGWRVVRPPDLHLLGRSVDALLATLPA